MSTLRDVSRYQTTTYHLRFEPSGWAVVTVDDETGTLSVASDWGNYCHRLGRGPWLCESNLLSDALGRLGANYLTDKLFYGHQRDDFDPVETMRELRSEVLEQRRARRITLTEARDRWDALCRLLGTSQHEAIDVLYEWYEAPWELLKWTATAQYVAILEVVMPAFLMTLRATRAELRDCQAASPANYAAVMAALASAPLVADDGDDDNEEPAP